MAFILTYLLRLRTPKALDDSAQLCAPTNMKNVVWFFTPTALRNLAQGCASRATLGSRSPNCLSTLKGLKNVSHVFNPFRVGTWVAMGLMLASQPGVLRRAKLFNAFGVRLPANFRTAAPPDVRWRTSTPRGLPAWGPRSLPHRTSL